MPSDGRSSETAGGDDGRLVYLAVELGMLEAVRELACGGASLEYRGPGRHTPLTLSCGLSDRVAIASSLIDLGADVNAKSEGGTALHYASFFGKEELVRKLLEAGADPFASLSISNSSCPMQITSYGPVVRIFENHVGRFSGWVTFKSPKSSQPPMLRWMSLMPYRPVGENKEYWYLVLFADDRSSRELETFCLVNSSVEFKDSKFLKLTSPSKKIVWHISPPSSPSLVGPIPISQLYILCSILRFPKDLVIGMPTQAPVNRGDPPPFPSTVELTSMSTSVENQSLLGSDDLMKFTEVPGPDGTMQCGNCGTKTVKAACVPCGHVTSCHNCTTKLWNQGKRCPVGGCKVESVIQIYRL